MRIRYALLAVGTLALGLAWRLAPLHLPLFLYKYGGSMLWAAMIYWLLALAFPAWPPLRLALIACRIAAVVEFLKLLHAPGPDAFRLTLAGKLLLGRFFSFTDIAAYWLAIAGAAWMDAARMRKAFKGAA